MHPLRWIALLFTAVFVAAALLLPFFGYVKMFFPLLALAAGIGLLLWRFPVAQIRGVITGFHEIVTTQPVFGFAVLLSLTGVYAFLLWVGYSYGAGLLQQHIGISSRKAWLLVTVLGLPAIPALWRLYSAAGIPGDAAMIGRGSRALAFFALAFFAYWYYAEPNRFFDPVTGKAMFLIAEKEGKPYFVGDIAEPKWTYSPATGEELRPGTQKDVERIKKEPWTDHLKFSAPFSKSPQALSRGVSLPSLPFCNDPKTIGFPHGKTTTVELELEPHCKSDIISLPVVSALRGGNRYGEKGSWWMEFEDLHAIHFSSGIIWDEAAIVAAMKNGGWQPTIPYKSFSLSGTGTVTVTVEFPPRT